MQSKKLLSVVVALVLLCTCVAGMLIFSANAAEIKWTVVDGATGADNKYGTLQAALDAAAEKNDWAEDAELVIEIQSTTAQIVDEEADILFGIPTIFRANLTRLPITIQGETGNEEMNAGNLTGAVNCSISYTFKNLKSDIGRKGLRSFYAGSGEVVFEDVDFGVTDTTAATTRFSADCSTVTAFNGWTAEHVAKAKAIEKAISSDELVKTSLTFRRIEYSNVGGTSVTNNSFIDVVTTDSFGDSNIITIADLKLETIIDNSTTGPIMIHRTGVKKAVGKEILTVTGGSETGRIIGVRESALKNDHISNNLANQNKYVGCKYNMVININDATVSGSLVGLEYAKRDVNLEINIVKGALSSVSLVGSGSELTNATLNIEPQKNSDVTVANEVTGATGANNNTNGKSAAKVTGTLKFNITGGTFSKVVRVTHYGGTYGAIVGIIENNISGGDFTADSAGFYGTGNYAEVTSVTNNIYGGKFYTYYGAGSNVIIDTLTNNIYDGTFAGWYGAGRSIEIKTSMKNNFYGGVYNTNVNGYDGFNNTTVSIKELLNYIKTTKNPLTNEDTVAPVFKRHFRATGEKALGLTSVKNYVSEGTFNMGFFPTGWGVQNANLDVYTEISGGSFKSFCASQANQNTYDEESQTNTPLNYKTNKTIISGGSFTGNISRSGEESQIEAEHNLNAITILVEGTISISKTSSVEITGVMDSKTVTFNQTEAWVNGHEYVTFPESVKDSVNYSKAASVPGSAAKTETTIVGNGGLDANLSLSDRVVLNVYFPDSITLPYDYSIQIGTDDAITGTIPAGTASEGGFYKVEVAAVHASRFGDEIVYSAKDFYGVSDI